MEDHPKLPQKTGSYASLRKAIYHSKTHSFLYQNPKGAERKRRDGYLVSEKSFASVRARIARTRLVFEQGDASSPTRQD
ncbi:hypothetical protein BHE74_00028226 [Ensete ventricosum]|nr:hypothetical protein GW17_00015758 [Ensete ventricosum]RWW64522.1 hypothetical protein BHE74_00028226 [Ensete ventricosum]